MKLDKELYRQAYELHRQYNEAELRERLRNAGKRLSMESWRQFVDLWEFIQQMRLKPSRWEQEQKMMALNRYYERLQKLEAQRVTKRVVIAIC